MNAATARNTARSESLTITLTAAQHALAADQIHGANEDMFAGLETEERGRSRVLVHGTADGMWILLERMDSVECNCDASGDYRQAAVARRIRGRIYDALNGRK